MPISIYGETNPDLAKFTVSRNASIWRYMDIGKYLDVITRRRIRFSRVVELRKTDPYEGTLTEYDQKKMISILGVKTNNELQATLIRYNVSNIVEMIDKWPDKPLEWFQMLFLKGHQYVERNAYMNSVSCWHQNQDESDAMWALYAQRNAGVAIKSNVNRILKAFKSSEQTMHVAKVNYDSKNNLSSFTSGMYDSILIKRHAFEHENEVRIIAPTIDEDNNPKESLGSYIDCDIHSLIEEVVISPLMPPYAHEALENISKKILPDIQIRKSLLLTKQEIPWMASNKLRAMWTEYLKTGFF
jgi:hypothetical protein